MSFIASIATGLAVSTNVVVSMVKIKCIKSKRRLLGVVSLMAVVSVCFLLIHHERMRRFKTRIIFQELGSRNTTELINPTHDTILVDSTKGWVDKSFSENHVEFQNLVRENILMHGNRTQMRSSSNSPSLVLIVVISELGNQKARQAIRQSWYIWARKENIEVVFFLGLPPNANTSMTELEAEIREYEDVIVDDHKDTYYLLAAKVLRILKWFNSTYLHEVNFPKFLVKTDDDVFIHVPNLVKQLRNVKNTSNYIAGYMRENTSVIRNAFDKWFIPVELWQPEYLPNFLAGPCYMMASTLVPSLYAAGLEEKLFHLEDVFLTGMVAHTALQIKLHGLGEDAMVDEQSLKHDINITHLISFHPATATSFIMQKFYRRVELSLIT